MSDEPYWHRQFDAVVAWMRRQSSDAAALARGCKQLKDMAESAHRIRVDYDCPSFTAATAQGVSAAVQVTLDTMCEHPESADVQEAASSALAWLWPVLTAVDKPRFASCAVAFGVAALNTLAANDRTHTAAFTVLGEMIGPAEGLLLVAADVAADAASALIGVLCAHADCAWLQINACGLLSAIIEANAAIQHSAVLEGAVEVAVAALQTHPDDADVQSRASVLLLHATNGIATAAVSAYTAGAMACLLTALRAHANDGNVQRSCVWALSVLEITGRPLLGQLMLQQAVSAGAFQLIVTALATHGAAESTLQQHGSRMLADMCSVGRPGAALAGRAVHALIAATFYDAPAAMVTSVFHALRQLIRTDALIAVAGDAGAPAKIVRTLQVRISDTALSAEGFALLEVICRDNETNAKAAAVAGAHEVIVKVMCEHRADKSVQDGGCSALAVLSRQLGYAGKAVAADIITTVVDALRNFHHLGLCRHGCAVLASTTSAQNALHAVAVGAIEVLAAAMQSATSGGEDSEDATGELVYAAAATMGNEHVGDAHG
jgi:hypothetical protein